MPESMPFREVQYRFTRHIRDPEHAPAPDSIEARRMAIYTDLLYRNVEGFMANSFPVLRKITADDNWHAMIRDYFKRHQAHTPLFPRMPLEFIHYLENERNTENDPPFMLELACYEWAEMAVFLDNREADMTDIDPEGNLLSGVPVLSPITTLLTCQYPVHTIGPDNLPETKPDQPTYLVVYRDHEYRVGFLELNPVSARLLALIKEDTNTSGKKLLEQIAAELRHPDPAVVVKGGMEIMQNMTRKGILLGTRIR